MADARENLQPMQNLLGKIHSFSSIGTFVLTIVIVILMVVPMVSHPDTQPTPENRGIIMTWIMPSILAGCIILAGVLNFLAARTQKQMPSTDRRDASANVASLPMPLPTVTTQSEPGRVFAHASPGELTAIRQTHTELQATKLSEVYIGTWLRISGSVSDVHTTMRGIAVYLHDVEGVIALVDCSFGEEWVQRCSILRKGDKVWILGAIAAIGATTLTLEHCELAQ